MALISLISMNEYVPLYDDIIAFAYRVHYNY